MYIHGIPKEGANKNKMESCATTMQWMLGPSHKKRQEYTRFEMTDSAWIPLFNLAKRKYFLLSQTDS